jgi:hypothetical protein
MSNYYCLTKCPNKRLASRKQHPLRKTSTSQAPMLFFSLCEHVGLIPHNDLMCVAKSACTVALLVVWDHRPCLNTSQSTHQVDCTSTQAETRRLGYLTIIVLLFKEQVFDNFRVCQMLARLLASSSFASSTSSTNKSRRHQKV